MDWLKQHRAEIVGTIAALAVLWIALSSESFQACVNAQQNAKAEKSFYESIAHFLIALGVLRGCIGYFISEAGNAITALATVAIGWFTWTLWRSSEATIAQAKATGELAEKQFLMEGRQADLAEKQHGLMRLQHIAANKPRLSIRGVNLGLPYAAAHSYFVEGQPIKGSLVVANNGATDARIIDSGYRFFWSRDGIPMRPPLDAPDVTELLLADDPIVGYGSRGVQIESKTALDGTYTFDTAIAGGTKLYLMGYIHYADINGAERFMGFCRQYTRTDAFGREGRFVAINNPDYEYSD